MEHADQELDEVYTYRVLGLALSNIPANEYGLIKKCGQIKNPGWSLQPGQEYYLGEDGEIIDELSQTASLKICIGVATGVDALSISLMKI